MQLTAAEANQVKTIYSNFHAGFLNAEEALDELEQVLNADSAESPEGEN